MLFPFNREVFFTKPYKYYCFVSQCKNMEEIFSEGQRRVREKHVSLPYHRPKQRSLDEFLQRRRMVDAVPLRTSGDKMKDVWRKIEELEKDAETFYKSEDEPDDDSDEDYCPDKEKKKDSSEEQGPGSNVPANENDLNLVNTTDKKDESSDDIPCDKSSPVKENTGKSIENSENTDNTVDFSLHLSEKFSDNNSVEGSQVENSEEFSLKLPESMEASCTESVNTPVMNKGSEASNECFDKSNQDEVNSKVVDDENEVDSKVVHGENEVNSKVVHDKNEISSKVVHDENELNSKMVHDESEVNSKVVHDKNEISSKVVHDENEVNSKVVHDENEENSKVVHDENEINSKVIQNENEINSKVIHDENEVMSKKEKDTPLAIDPKTDEIGLSNKSGETVEKSSLVEGENQPKEVDNCNDSACKGETSIKNKSDQSDKKINELIPESDPTFSLHLEESQDALEVQANAGTNNAEENKASETTTDESKEESLEKIDWMNLKGFSDDELDFESTPKIKQSSNDFICLDDSPPRKHVGVEKLKEQFFKHASCKTVHKKKKPVQLNVTTTTKDEENKIDGLHRETFTIAVEEETVVGPQNEKPGARLTKLQIELKKKMAIRRQEEWQKRLKEHKEDEEEADDDEKSDCGGLFDDDDDFVHPETESEDSDLEEDDIDLSDKKKKKSAFVDDEAEEDEDEDEEENENGECEDDIESSKVEKKVKKRSVITDEDYEGDDDVDENEDDKEDDNDKKAEDDDWMLGQTKLRSQLTARIPNSNPESKPELQKTPGESLDDSIFNFTFDGVKLGNSFDESELNKTSKHEISGMENLINVKNSENVTESQVLELCSGQFQTQPPEIEDEDDNFVVSPTQQSFMESSQSQNAAPKKFDPLLSSDEETEIESTVPKKKKAALVYSDDEDDPANSKEECVEKESDEEYEKEDLEDEDNANTLDNFPEENEEDDNRSVMYDSEENEIVVTKKDVGQFFDKEAELSESDWDSEDEDEKGLDKMDAELGDQEHFDDDEIQKQLEKFRMRQILDDDQRDIKQLQERFLEDGELHSEGGREKNFKWRNINDEALNAIWRQRRNSEGEEPEEEEEANNESDEIWRQMQKEKNDFFKKNKDARFKDDELLDEAVANQFLQLSKKAKLSSDSKPLTKKLIDLDEPILGKSISPATILSKTANLFSAGKGSFLLRSSQIKSRIGPVAVTGNETKLNNKANNSRNFVFAVKSPTKDFPEDSQDSNFVNKRKPDPVSPVANKKPRFMEERKPIISNRRSLLSRLNFDKD